MNRKEAPIFWVFDKGKEGMSKSETQQLADCMKSNKLNCRIWSMVKKLASLLEKDRKVKDVPHPLTGKKK